MSPLALLSQVLQGVFLAGPGNPGECITGGWRRGRLSWRRGSRLGELRGVQDCGGLERVFPGSALPPGLLPTGSHPSTHILRLILSPFLPEGKDLVSEQTFQIQEAPETELWGTGRGLVWEAFLPVSLLPTPAIPLGSPQGRGPACWELWQQLWSLVSAPLPGCSGSTPYDVSLGKGGPGP